MEKEKYQNIFKIKITSAKYNINLQITGGEKIASKQKQYKNTHIRMSVYMHIYTHTFLYEGNKPLVQKLSFWVVGLKLIYSEVI